jgi:acyl-coenzyme A thioesterase PaaI-like protein
VPLKTPTPTASPHLNFKTSEELGNHCFGCGALNPQGLHLRFEVESSHPDRLSAAATIELTEIHEGAPGCVHGGIIATMLDEAMSKLNRPLKLVAMTRHMEVDYLQPVRLATPLKIVSYHVRRDGKKIFHAAEVIGPDGSVLARAKGLFVIIDPALVSRKRQSLP